MLYRRRNIANTVVLAAALIFILYQVFSGRSSASANRKTFAWTKVRYRSTPTDELPARGSCTGVGFSDKPALVVSRVEADGNPGWLNSLSNKYHLCVYTADGPRSTELTHLQVPANRGHESMGYLTFIIDNYNHLPEAGAVFVHGSRFQWHNDAPDYDNAALLKALNVSSALEVAGYHNLRCDWSASTCDVTYAPPQGSFETAFNAMFTPWDARAKSDAAFSTALASLFGGSGSLRSLPPSLPGREDTGPRGGQLRLGRGDAVRSQCCAQFVVGRDNIWRHSREEYIAIRQWLLDTQVYPGNPDTAPADDRIAGRILSYIWHILFLPAKNTEVELSSLNRMACPRADECYCRLYGRCDLADCLTPGRCFGQYAIPPDFALPEDWAERHATSDMA